MLPCIDSWLVTCDLDSQLATCRFCITSEAYDDLNQVLVGFRESKVGKFYL